MTGVVALAALSGCAGFQSYVDGRQRLESGDVSGGLAKLHQATQENPANSEYRITYFSERDRQRNAAMHDLDLALEAGDFSAADVAHQHAREIDPLHPKVIAALDRIAASRRLAGMLDTAEEYARAGRVDEASVLVRRVLSEVPTHRRAQQMYRPLLRAQADRPGKDLGLYPRLRDTYRRPISLSLTQATLLQAFEALKQASGLNFMFDREVRSDQPVTLSVSGKSVEDVLRLLLVTNQLDKRVLDEDTLLIYPNSPQKTRDYQDLVVRSFYLSNADINKAATLVRTIGRARDVFVDDKLNMLVVRDTPEVVRLCEKLLANQDLADPEVVLELEVMEVSTKIGRAHV